LLQGNISCLGNKQEYDIDYDETFALIAKMTIIRIVLFIATSNGWSLHQIDVNNAFLHGELTKDTYMLPPHDLLSSSTCVCMLKHSLYGLK